LLQGKIHWSAALFGDLHYFVLSSFLGIWPITPSHLGITTGDFSLMIHITENGPNDGIQNLPQTATRKCLPHHPQLILLMIVVLGTHEVHLFIASY